MKNKFILMGLSVIVALLSMSALAVAQEARAGEIWLQLKGSDYARPSVDGETWEDHEFENDGYKLVIKVRDIDKVWEFELKPSNSALQTATFTTDPKKFKLKRIRGRTGRYIMKGVVKFKKAPPAKK